jgi:hypothetical protein
MPTRITLKQNAPKLVQAKMRSKAALSPTFLHASDASSPPPPQRHESRAPTTTTTTAVAVNKRRQLPTFRSSILRELSDKSGVVDIEKERMATDDIRASPRLVGYLFSMIAGAVMLVSVAQLSILCYTFLVFFPTTRTLTHAQTQILSRTHRFAHPSRQG